MKKHLTILLLITALGTIGFIGLHEIGHMIAGVAFGCNVHGFGIGNGTGTVYAIIEPPKESWKTGIIYAAGVFFPYVTNLMLLSKRPYVWYAGFVSAWFSGINCIYFVISIFLYFSGYKSETDDLQNAFRMIRHGALMLTVLTVLVAVPVVLRLPEYIRKLDKEVL